MNKTELLAIGLFISLLFGCTNTDNNTENDNGDANTQPINYETNEERSERLGNRDLTIGQKGGYPQSDQSDLNGPGQNDTDSSDIFTNDESKKIMDHLQQRKDVKLAQVASTDDKIMIGIMVQDYANPDINDEIADEVQRMAPGKKIVVYTDDVYWEKMKNLKSRWSNPDEKEQAKRELKEFFNME